MISLKPEITKGFSFHLSSFVVVEIEPGGRFVFLAVVDGHDLDAVLEDERAGLEILHRPPDGSNSSHERHLAADAAANKI